MVKFIVKYFIIGTMFYVIALAINGGTAVNGSHFIERSCTYVPSICYSGQEVFYNLGTYVRNGLHAVYLLADKYLTEQPIENTHIKYRDGT